MEIISMCRICLASNVQLRPIPSHMQDIYEKISSVKFQKKDGRPLVACYICRARLQGCYRVGKNCVQGDRVLSEMMSSTVLKPENIASINTFKVVRTSNFSEGFALRNRLKFEEDEEEGTVLQIKEEPRDEEEEHSADEPQEESDDDDHLSHFEESLEDDDVGDSVVQSSGGSRRNLWRFSPSWSKPPNDNPGSAINGAGTKNNEIAALKDTKDASTQTTKKRELSIEIKGETEAINIDEPNIDTKKTRVEEATSSKTQTQPRRGVSTSFTLHFLPTDTIRPTRTTPAGPDDGEESIFNTSLKR